MNRNSDITLVARLLAEPSRAAMMTALLDGRAMPAGDLARIAQVSPQTASGHLRKLLAGGLVHILNQGRHRYYSIATPEIAHAIETLSGIATQPPVTSLRQSLAMEKLAAARTCYDHLAGRLAVRLADRLVERGHCDRTEDGFAITPAGASFFATLEIDSAALCKTTPPYSKTCVDWTERRPHLAGPIGRALLAHMFAREWIARTDVPRALRITDAGHESLARHFGIVTS